MKVFFAFLFLMLSCKADLKNIPDAADPKPLPEGVTRVCVIGDAGNGSEDQYYVARALETEGCSMVLYVGDVIYERGITSPEDKDFKTKFLDPYKSLLEKRKTPFYISMGNHDWYWPGDGKHWLEIDKNYDLINYPNYWYSYEMNGLCLIQIETYEEKHHKAEKAWLDTIKNNLSCEFTIAFGHNPYLSRNGYHGNAVGKMKEFLKDAVIGRFDVYTAGHDHNLSDEGLVEGTSLLVSGCGGKKRGLIANNDVPFSKGEVVGYLVIDVKGNEAQYRFMSVDKMTSTKEHQGNIVGSGIRR